MKHRLIQKMTAALLSGLLVGSLSLSALAAPPAKPGGSSSASVSYSGATTITASMTATGAAYTSSTAGQNALLVSGGTSTLTNATVTKTGDDSSGDNADFYGTNAAVLVYNGAALNLKGGSVTTNGAHANGVFATGTGTVSLEDTVIKTTGNTSGGIMVTGGGTLTGKNLTVETSGNSSAAIRSDRGGGTLTVNGGTYTTHGNGSPAIYSTADITVNNAVLNATTSEGVVIEGKNSVTLSNVTLTDSNVKHNGQSTTYKTIFLYQSMSGDASVGTSHFTAKDSSITGENGDLFYITNTSAVIDLENNALVYRDTDGGFLRAEAAAWGSSGKNGGTVALNLSNQKAQGDIFVDSISTLDMTLRNGSVYGGTINAGNTARQIGITLSADSVWVLTSDSYITSLTNADAANSNIYLNGHTLTVNGKAVSGNTGTYEGSDAVSEQPAAAFRDVAQGSYYYDAVSWAVQNNVTAGVDNTHFAPDTTCTRAQVVTFLWRAAGSPEPTSAVNPFTDVPSGQYYSKAVLWAVEKGITAGATSTTFDPAGDCTRGQVVTFLYRFAGSPGVSTGSANSFTDVPASAYYTTPVQWAVQAGVTYGVTPTAFAPATICTRGQVMTFLYRAVQ